jgi:outer membrane protein OmpA-like peptidoglycan-associated protein
VPDNKDLCALEPGLPENNGCPKVEEQLEIVELDKEEEKVLKEAFDNLEFETGKSVIQKESYTSLDELVTLLNAKPDYRIYIAGHTDNVGRKKANIKLSKDRANAVKKYLIDKGIDVKRIKTEGFGDSRPAASNKTPEGRQKNRRVEFRIIK